MDLPSGCQAGQSCVIHPSVYNTYGFSLLASVVDKRHAFLGLDYFSREKLASELAADIHAHSSLLTVTAAAAGIIESDLKDIWSIVSYRGHHERTASAAAACSLGAVDAALDNQGRRARRVERVTKRIRVMLHKAIMLGVDSHDLSEGVIVRSVRAWLKTDAGKRHRAANARAEQWSEANDNDNNPKNDDMVMYTVSQALLFRDAAKEEAWAALAWWLALEEVERAASTVQVEWSKVNTELDNLDPRITDGLFWPGVGWIRWLGREVVRLGSCRCVKSKVGNECTKETALDEGVREKMDEVDAKLSMMVEQLHTAMEKLFNVGKEVDGIV